MAKLKISLDILIHVKILNCESIYVINYGFFHFSFLCLVPDEAKSSYHVEGTGYDTYLRDAHRQVGEVTNFVKWNLLRMHTLSLSHCPVVSPEVSLSTQDLDCALTTWTFYAWPHCVSLTVCLFLRISLCLLFLSPALPLSSLSLCPWNYISPKSFPLLIQKI